MLKAIRIKLLQISDINKYLFIEKTLRGGFLTFIKDIVNQRTKK